MNIYWKPKAWVAILLGVFLQAFTFLYINRPKLFWMYFLLSCLISLLDWRYQTSFIVIFSLLCPIHAYFVVKKYDHSCKRAWYSRWWGIPTVYGTFFMMVFLLRSFLYEPFVFPAGSMEPTIKSGNNILVQKIGYGTYGTYGFTLVNEEISSTDLMQRGKLYAFYPPERDFPVVKRLIALPGDTLSIRGNEITVNGSVLTTEKIYDTDREKIFKQQLNGVTYFIQRDSMRPSTDVDEKVLPEKSYFFMGDNRDNSADSRHWGYITSDSIIGEVVYIFE